MARVARGEHSAVWLVESVEQIDPQTRVASLREPFVGANGALRALAGAQPARDSAFVVPSIYLRTGMYVVMGDGWYAWPIGRRERKRLLRMRSEKSS